MATSSHVVWVAASTACVSDLPPHEQPPAQLQSSLNRCAQAQNIPGDASKPTLRWHQGALQGVPQLRCHTSKLSLEQGLFSVYITCIRFGASGCYWHGVTQTKKGQISFYEMQSGRCVNALKKLLWLITDQGMDSLTCAHLYNPCIRHHISSRRRQSHHERFSLPQVQT